MKTFARFAVLTFAITSYAAHVGMADEIAPTPAATTKPAGPADFRKMKELLPATLSGQPRTSAEGSRNSFGETAIAMAEASYGKDEGDAPKHGRITLVDYGNDSFASGAAVWLHAELDQESDTEYTKTIEVQGRRALLTYRKADRHGSLQTLAGGRMMVTLDFDGLADADFRKAVEELPLKKLDALVEGK
jgi:hypothetical protein